MVDSLKETKNGFLVLRNTPERWEELERFPLLPGDVFIVTYPRSGTTWMQQIVKLLRSDGQPDHVTVDRAIPWLEVGARLGLRIWTGHAHRPGARSLQCASARVICAGVFSLSISISCSYLPPPTGVYVIQNLAIELRKRTVHLATQPRTILNMNIHELLILPVPGFWNAQGPVRTR